MRKEEFLKSIDSKILKDSVIQEAYSKEYLNKEIIKNHTFSTGTTTVGITCKDVVILGTDKRATMAYFIASKTAEKLHKIQEHLFCTIAGSVADAQYLVEVLRAETYIYQLEKKSQYQ